ncbi:hypothetical protein H7F15_10705 [Pontibacter sp. Tf4]|uniref:hypothetical protein n=1 Tax=Pontibacter sp. Tf4 TaxID=2761620 RepID=UPI001624EAC9|nr:hypothetical protein [Pontibacter sp. Tf4]MBB6611507.1 hypothetical protein [Pontibacter sp. Tf4]
MKKHLFYTLGLATALYMATPLSAVHAQGNGKGQNKEAATNEEGNEKSVLRNRHERLKDKSMAAKKQQEAREKAKGNENGNQGKGGKPEKTGKPEKAGKPEKDNNGKGNAYGRNKGELSGREFGQARAVAAKQTNTEKRQELNKVVTTGDEKVTDAKSRLGRAIEELERQRKAGTITDSEYKEKQVTISRTEKAIQILEEKVNAAKVLVSAPVVE